MRTTEQIEQPSIETTIGLYWLHKLGIVSLVFGIAFLIMYSFQLFGPIFKLLTGLTVALTLLGLGQIISRKESERWFAHGLTAGGWSLAYFTAYAAYYLPSVQIITSLTLESLLLFGIAAGALLSSLQARSQMMATYSVLLATASIIFSGPSLLSDISFLMIAITTSILGNKEHWRKLFTVGLLACYIGHIYCSAQAMDVHDDVIASSFLAAIWLVLTIGLGYSVQPSEKARKFIAIVACVNSIAFATGLALFSGRHIPETSEMLLVSAGSVYLAAARWLHNRHEHQLKVVHSLLGLTLINIAKWMHFSEISLLAVDIMEIALLGTIGLRYGVRTFRWFAVLLSMFLFPTLIVVAPFLDISHPWLGFHVSSIFKIELCAAVVLMGLATRHLNSTQGLQLPKLYAYFYYVAANLMVVFAIFKIIDPSWQAIALVVQGIVNHQIALRMSDSNYAHPGTLSALMAAIVLLSLSAWNTTAIALIIILLYGAHGAARILVKRSKSVLAGQLQTAYAYGANILLTLFIFRQAPIDYVSTGIGLEGIWLLIVGFAWNDRLFRGSGLVALAILTVKLFLFDFAKLDTLERIISFIAAGVVFLLSFYAYTRWTRAFENETFKTERSSK